MITREPEFFAPPANWFGRLGRNALLACRGTGRGLLVLSEAFLCLRYAFGKRSRHEVLYQLYVTGIKSLGVVSVVAMFTGMILTLQTGLELRKFGQEVNVGAAVMLSMLREMGPFMTALILAASVGSAMAAELGSMTVSEEVTALEVMSINPVRVLVMPRLAAMMVMTPILTFYASLLGLAGGGMVAYTQLMVAVPAYIDNAMRFASLKDLSIGLLKSVVFGILITGICCYQGLATTRGAVGVGRATRRSVIISFLAILIVGYIITRLFY